VLEFDALIREKHPQTPVFWLGESMGALIMLHTAAASRNHHPPAGLVLLSPAVGIRDGVGRFKYWLARSSILLAPWRRITLAQLDPARIPQMRITSDFTQAMQVDTTPHYVPAHSLRLFGEVDKMMRTSVAAAGKLSLPVFVLYTPKDPVVSAAQVERWFEHFQTTDKSLLLFPEDYHLILHDRDRWRAVKEIAEWLTERAGRKPEQAGERR